MMFYVILKTSIISFLTKNDCHPCLFSNRLRMMFYSERSETGYSCALKFHEEMYDENIRHGYK